MDSQSEHTVAAIILAAGPSARFGTPKQLLSYKNRSLVRHAVEIAVSSSAHPVSVVLGFAAHRVRHEIADLPVDVIENPAWRGGMSTSIRAGIRTVPPTAEAAIILLCDQPLISTDLLNQMVAAFRSTRPEVVACEYGTSLGVPALFGRSLFPQLLALSGDKGAKQLLSTYSSALVRIPFPGGAVDIDTPEDYRKAIS